MPAIDRDGTGRDLTAENFSRSGVNRTLQNGQYPRETRVDRSLSFDVLVMMAE